MVARAQGGALAGQGGPGDGPPGMNAPASSSGEAPRAPPQRQALTRPPTGLSRLGAVAGMGLVCPRVRTRSAGPRDLTKRTPRGDKVAIHKLCVSFRPP